MQPSSLCLEKIMSAVFPPRENYLWLLRTWHRYLIHKCSRAEIDRSISRRVISRDPLLGGIPLLGISEEILWNFIPNIRSSGVPKLAGELLKRAIVRKLIRKVKLVHGKISLVESTCFSHPLHASRAHAHARTRMHPPKHAAPAETRASRLIPWKAEFSSRWLSNRFVKSHRVSFAPDSPIRSMLPISSAGGMTREDPWKTNDRANVFFRWLTSLPATETAESMSRARFQHRFAARNLRM